jgi:hypothetical protein
MLCENYKIVPVLSDNDMNVGDPTASGDSINMSAYHEATFIVGLQTLGGANPTVGVYSGATDGACTTFVPFRYAYGSAATGSASADVLAAWTKAVAVVTIAHASKDNFMLIIEVDAAEMASGHKWLTLQFGDPSTGATGNVQVHAILKPRFGSNVSVTALT